MRFVLLCALVFPALADEGMWLFNHFPKDQAQQKYNVAVSDELLERLRLSSMQIGSGSGSFVSPDGLIVTSHDVASECISKLSSAQHDYVREGFYAVERARELACPELEANVLLKIDDVSAAVKDASKNAKGADALQRRNAAIAKAEKDCAARTGNSCSVVKLFSGEWYHLYQYRKYTDLRLVFAPESGIAFFGGGADQFTYPRYDLDVAFLRAYENGKPASTPQHLKWSAEGVKDGELVLLAGNPGTTSRLDTAAQLTFLRDVSLPFTLSRLQTRIAATNAFAAKSAENARLGARMLSLLATTYKSNAGKLIGLKDDRLMARKQNFDKRLRSAVQNDPKLGAEAAKVWDEIAAAYKAWTPYEKPYEVLERPGAEGSTLFRIARQILRLTEERAKADGDRLPEYRESALRPLEVSLYLPAPISDDLEIAMLSVFLEDVKALGEKEAPVKAILAGRTPQAAAEAFVKESKLKDVAERKRLAADKTAARQSEDGMMLLARLLEEPSRRLLKKHEEMVESVETSAADRIAEYRFKIYGEKEYPDATFTPRVSFGAVKGYRDKTEAPVPYATTFGGMYHRGGAQDPYKLPPQWVGAKGKLNLVTPFNFVSTSDIMGGYSGSPTVNAQGEIVGIAFDNNIEGLSQVFVYTEDQARAVHVASQGIVEALRKVYGAAGLLRELGQ